MPNRRLLVVLSFALFFVLAISGWMMLIKLSRRSAPSVPEVTPVTVPTAVEANPQTSKVVLDEAKISSGETFKAVSGNLLSVEGRALILGVEDDRLKILVSPEAKITRTTLPAAGGSPTVVEITLADLEAGQKINALVKIDTEGAAVATDLNTVR